MLVVVLAAVGAVAYWRSRTGTVDHAPEQSVGDPNALNPGAGSFSTSDTMGYLSIPEWHVRLAVPTDVGTLSYEFNNARHPSGSVYLYSEALAAVDSSCKDAPLALLDRGKPGEVFTIANQTPEEVMSASGTGRLAHIGSYYYLLGHFEMGCARSASGHDLESKILQSLERNLPSRLSAL